MKASEKTNREIEKIGMKVGIKGGAKHSRKGG
jgi:hypothetical protein